MNEHPLLRLQWKLSIQVGLDEVVKEDVMLILILKVQQERLLVGFKMDEYLMTDVDLLPVAVELLRAKEEK